MDFVSFKVTDQQISDRVRKGTLLMSDILMYILYFYFT